ncbi:MAG TPA: hypothetical protein VKN76_04805 [Kiloniellaceae bacterium]|nr:hypothetical protein [Kiloniellaceae bacterium]
MTAKSKTDRGLARYFRRGPWEAAATALIALGVFMLMQPFSLALFGNSFMVILVGTIGFVIVSHFPD